MLNKHEVSLDGSLLSGIFTIKDGVKGGYPFVECILSVLPFCDRVLLNDGGSTDGTKDYLRKIQSMYPEKVNLFHVSDRFTTNWKSIDCQLNYLIKKCKSDWIFEIQGDEILDKKNSAQMVKEIKVSDGYNALRHSRLDLTFNSEDFHYDMRTIRIVRNVPDLSSYTGGDDFHIGDRWDVRNGFTLHNVPPERDVYSFVLKHYVRCFPGNTEEWARRHAQDLASDNPNRISIAMDTRRITNPKRATEAPSHVPEILRDMVGKEYYYVREELFSK
jgi:glycosyltransferase involved in cell wall biosynthesis